jgi:hypothetical protein
MHPADFHEKRSRYRGDISAHGRLISEFYYILSGILPIRQIDNTFIPLFFHWSGLLKSPNNVKKSLQRFLYHLVLTGFLHVCTDRKLWHIASMKKSIVPWKRRRCPIHPMSPDLTEHAARGSRMAGISRIRFHDQGNRK